ncbi:MAG: cation-translocating P-type ATPase [Nanoarchaeota archaeon]
MGIHLLKKHFNGVSIYENSDSKKSSDTKKLDSIENDNYWHLRTVDEVMSEVKSSKGGILPSEAKTRLDKFGQNKISQEKKFDWLGVLFSKINSILIYVLFAASLIALISGEVLEFGIIIVIILFTIFLGFFQEFKADKTINALSKLSAKKVLVLRGNKKVEISSEELVVGDIVFLKRGDIVPADMRLIEVSGLQINESIITGESKERAKITEHLSEQNLGIGDMKNMAFSSTFVTGGSGVGVVVETGKNTIIGKISVSIESIAIQKSPIQKKIDGMSKRISYIVLVVALLLFILLILKGNNFYFSLLLVSAVAIAGIPESFPLALTLAFSNGIKNMAKNNAIVKDLNSVETLGTTTVICSDKTGTLTQNNMRVTSVYFSEGSLYEVKGVGYNPINSFSKDGSSVRKEDVIRNEAFFKSIILCNESNLEFNNGVWKLDGEPTEGALLTLGKSVDIDENSLREDNKTVHVEPFNPLKKYMVVVCNDLASELDDGKKKSSQKNSCYDFYLKGAGEIVLEMCSSYRDSNGKIVEMTNFVRKKFVKKIEEFNSSGLRVLSVASKSKKFSGSSEKKFIDSHLTSEYVFEGFVGIEDPIREEVFDAVKHCQSAGVKIVMITGDHKLIAENIGQKLNILKKGDRIIEGFELEKMSDSELDEIISEVGVFARTTPEHKLRIVKSFQRKGEIVAMTGDGVNDAPALKKADIGISMGKNGTEVAREASNMVLTDDNFATIVKAVKEGRTVYSNIRRFIFYLLTGNFTEVFLILFAVSIGIPLPLTAIMMLFVNLVTSTIPALALSVQSSNDKVMLQKPRKPTERLLSSYILTKILVLIPFLIFGILGLFWWQINILGNSVEKAMTIAFATIICFELFHAFNARRLHTTIFDKDFFKEKLLFLAIMLSVVLTFIAIHTSFGQKIFETIDLALFDWIWIVGLSSTIILFSEVVKLSIKAEFEEQSHLQGINFKLK